MFRTCRPSRPIVFLHLPKTGGQTIHAAIRRRVGRWRTAPHRVQGQVGDGATFPPGYALYSGHLHWHGLEDLAGDPFSFMVLRDPRERLGSMFFYMQKKARQLRDRKGHAALTPVQAALVQGPAALFFADDDALRIHVQRNWANVTLTYLATRALRRSPAMQEKSIPQLLQMAEANSHALSAIYRFGEFEKIEADLAPIIGKRPRIVGNRANRGPLEASRSRWDALLDTLETDAQRRGIEAFVAEDMDVMARISFR